MPKYRHKTFPLSVYFKAASSFAALIRAVSWNGFLKVDRCVVKNWEKMPSILFSYSNNFYISMALRNWDLFNEIRALMGQILSNTITKTTQYMMRFRKPWLRVKSVNFDFSAKSSSTDYNESNNSTRKSLAHIGSKKSLVELEVPKISFFIFSHFSLYWKVCFSPWAMDSVKSSSTDYKESYKPNL